MHIQKPFLSPREDESINRFRLTVVVQQVQDFDVFNALDVMENESFLKDPGPFLVERVRYNAF